MTKAYNIFPYVHSVELNMCGPDDPQILCVT